MQVRLLGAAFILTASLCAGLITMAWYSIPPKTSNFVQPVATSR